METIFSLIKICPQNKYCSSGPVAKKKNLSEDKWNVNSGQKNFECIYGSFLFDILVILFPSNIRKLIAL